jgi:hypothetical protein
VIWACPLVIEFLGLFSAFSRLFFSIFFPWNFHLPPIVGCDLSRVFFLWKKNYLGSKRDCKGYTFQNVKGITKIAFPHFKRKQLRSINFGLVQCDGLVFAKRCISWVYEQWVHYIPLFIHLKQHVSRVIVWGWQFIFYSCILVQSLVTSVKELLDSCVILQVECHKYCFK